MSCVTYLWPETFNTLQPPLGQKKDGSEQLATVRRRLATNPSDKKKRGLDSSR
jgi:hypothetical protein